MADRAHHGEVRPDHLLPGRLPSAHALPDPMLLSDGVRLPEPEPVVEQARQARA